LLITRRWNTLTIHHELVAVAVELVVLVLMDMYYQDREDLALEE
jgi:hypothetical protein